MDWCSSAPASRRRDRACAPVDLDGAAAAAAPSAFGQQAADFEDQFASAVIEAGGQRVRRFLIVVIRVLAACTNGRFGPFRIAQAPAAIPISCTP